MTPVRQFDWWKCFFTFFDPQSKRVAILIKDCGKFEYICHDEDFSGGYLVLTYFTNKMICYYFVLGYNCYTFQ